MTKLIEGVVLMAGLFLFITIVMGGFALIPLEALIQAFGSN